MNKGKFDNDKPWHDNHGYQGGFIKGNGIMFMRESER